MCTLRPTSPVLQGMRNLSESAYLKDCPCQAPWSRLPKTSSTMKIVMPKVKGRADGKKVNETVKSLLSGG